MEPLPLPFKSIKPYLRCTADRLAFIAASPTTVPAVVTLCLPDRRVEVLADPGVYLDEVSIPERLWVPAEDGGTVPAVNQIELQPHLPQSDLRGRTCNTASPN